MTDYSQGITGGISPIGSAGKLTARRFMATLFPTSDMIREATLLLISGNSTISPVGVLSASKSVLALVVGGLTFAGTVAKDTLKQTVGSVSPIGALSAIRSVLVSLSGALDMSGTLIKQTSLRLSANLDSQGGLTKALNRLLAGVLDMIGVAAGVIVSIFLPDTVEFDLSVTCSVDFEVEL